MTENEQPKESAKKEHDLSWERDVLNKLANAALDEQRRTRRWNIFFKSLFFVYLFVLLVMLMPTSFQSEKKEGKHTALVDVQGTIAEFGDASADNIVAGLRAAFENEQSAGVILRINSPGGSPVQSGYIYDEIRRLRKDYPDKQIYAVIGDMCASGGYYVAAATDAIYADKASIVGSIGVLMNGFGFVGTMEKLGVERRLFTAGENKGFLDPFSPVQEGEVTHLQGLLNSIHQQFIKAVKDGRGERLKDNPKIFTGLVWSGEEGLALGLVDGLGSPGYVAREVIGAEDIINYTPQPEFFEQVFQRFGTASAKALVNSLAQPSVR